jgi:hypothetical protein
MEAAGLATGVTGLIGLFSSCLDIVKRWDSNKDFGIESGSIIARFVADRIRFQQWGRGVGIDKSRHGDDHHKALDDPLLRSAVDQILQSIKHIDSDTRDFALAQNKSVLPRGHAQFEKFQGATLRKSKLRLELRNKARFVALVELFNALVQKLYDLVPPDQSTVPSQIVSGARNSNIASLNGMSYNYLYVISTY